MPTGSAHGDPSASLAGGAPFGDDPTMVARYVRRLGFVAALMVLGYLVVRLVPEISGNVLVDVVVDVAIFAALGYVLFAAFDDAEHGRAPFGGRFSRR